MPNTILPQGTCHFLQLECSSIDIINAFFRSLLKCPLRVGSVYKTAPLQPFLSFSPRVFSFLCNLSPSDILHTIWIICYYFSKKILFERQWEREREKHDWGWEGTEGEADSSLSREPDVGVDPGTLRSWPELKADALSTEPLRCPSGLLLFVFLPWGWETLFCSLLCPQSLKLGSTRGKCSINIC